MTMQVLAESAPQFRDTLSVGIVQTTINGAAAWREQGGPPMAEAEALRALAEIERAISWFGHDHTYPDILITPELTVAHEHRRVLREMCCATGSLLIAGLDYRRNYIDMTVRNEAVLFVPAKWPQKDSSSHCQEFTVGKTYVAPEEARLLAEAGWKFRSDPSLWVFETGAHGRFGVCICYDLMDIARLLMYRRQVHHLFVLAYNRDTTSFNHICEAACRTLYCNMVICNTGYFGGSVALTPYYQPWKRPTLRIQGQRLSAVECVDLPVANIARAWEGEGFGNGDDRLKELPPGFNEETLLAKEDAVLPPIIRIE